MTDREALKRVIKTTNVYKPLRVITNDISYRRKTKGNKKKHTGEKIKFHSSVLKIYKEERFFFYSIR
jgi:hypothetical protein